MNIPDEEVLQFISKHKGTKILVRSIAGVQRRALLCINNLITLLPIDSVGGLEGLSALWDKLSQMANNKHGTYNLYFIIPQYANQINCAILFYWSDYLAFGPTVQPQCLIVGLELVLADTHIDLAHHSRLLFLKRKQKN